jgi:hypothetical protein
LESGYLKYGATPDEAYTALRDLTLHELKAHLEQLIETRKGIPDW